MIVICPRCQRRVIAARHSGDVIHECQSGDSTLDQEDVLDFGQSFVDYAGSGGVVPSKPGAPLGDELAGTDAGVRGARFGGVTERGKKKFLYRQRRHLEFIDLPDDC